MTYLPHPRQNLLLNMAYLNNCHSLFSHLELVYLLKEQILHDFENTSLYSYFPVSVAISYVIQTPELKVEIETIRNDGLLGLPLLINGSTEYQASVQCSGFAYKILTTHLEKEMANSYGLVSVFLRYQQLRMAKIAQMSACSRCHTIEEQLCRILLNVLDYSHDKLIHLTQQTLADKLNVRRETITYQMSKLQDKQLLDFMRGKIVILNRQGIEDRACDCYAIIKEETARLFKKWNPKDSHEIFGYVKRMDLTE